MRSYGTPIIVDLTSSSNPTPSVTPGAAAVPTKFQFQSLPAKIRRLWLYAHSICFRVRIGLDQPGAGGSAVNRDKLYKIIDSVSLFSPVLGHIYPATHTRGAVMGNIIQVMGNGYRYPTPLAAQVAAADGDTAIDLYVRIPLAMGFLERPQDTAPLLALLEGGELEIRIAANNVLDGDSTGLVTETPCTINAWVECFASADAYVHGAFGFREYESPGSTTRAKLVNFGKAEGLQGISEGCSLGALMMLTDATGIGLSGNDGTDNVTRVESPDALDQRSTENPDAFMLAFLNQIGHEVIRPLTTVVSGTGGFPFTFAAGLANKMNDAQALFLPLRMPSMGFKLSHAKKFSKVRDLEINYAMTSTPSGNFRHLTLEFYGYKPEFVADLKTKFGLPESAVAVPKLSNGKELHPRTLRSTQFGVARKFYAR